MGQKVTDFNAKAAPATDDVFYLVQTSDDTDKKITFAQLAAQFDTSIQNVSASVTATTPTANSISIVNVDAGTATVTIPSGVDIGGRVLVRKISSTAGTVTIARSSTDTFTRAALTSVTLTSDGDFWVLEKVTATRWELVDGVESGSNATSAYERTSEGLQVYRAIVTLTESTTNRLLVTLTLPSFVGIICATCTGSTSSADYVNIDRTQIVHTIQTVSAETVGFAYTGSATSPSINNVSLVVTGRWYT